MEKEVFNAVLTANLVDSTTSGVLAVEEVEEMSDVERGSSGASHGAPWQRVNQSWDCSPGSRGGEMPFRCKAERGKEGNDGVRRVEKEVMNAVLAADLVNSTRYQLSTLLSGTRPPGPAPVFCSSAPLVSFVLSRSVPSGFNSRLNRW